MKLLLVALGNVTVVLVRWFAGLVFWVVVVAVVVNAILEKL